MLQHKPFRGSGSRQQAADYVDLFSAGLRSQAASGPGIYLQPESLEGTVNGQLRTCSERRWMPPSPSSTREELRAKWTELYSTCLPELARAKAPSQPSWPVHLDHCFGRMILDVVVGKAKAPWKDKLKGPAVKNMSEEQLEGCLDLGEKIADGSVNLVELDEQSLKSRGKVKGGMRGVKRKQRSE